MTTTLTEHSSELVSIISILFALLIGLIGLIYRLVTVRINENSEKIYKIENVLPKLVSYNELTNFCEKSKEFCPKSVLIETFGIELKTISTNILSIKENIEKIMKRQEYLREITLPNLEKNIAKEYVSIENFNRVFNELKSLIQEKMKGDK